MSLQDLPTELVLNIFRHCTSISSAINLSLTCRRYYHLLRTSQKIPVLFAIAERVWGPLEDIHQLLTYNSAQPIHTKRMPVLSFALLVQVSRIGRVATWYEEMYPQLRWDGERAHLRRSLTPAEAYALRRAIYRIWLYSVAFHNSSASRTMRLNPSVVSERCQLLRTWSSPELLEMEDVRGILETMASDFCPTDGEVYWRRGSEPLSKYSVGSRAETLDSSLFHDFRAETMLQAARMKPVSEYREQMMEGWGDEIEQYHVLNDVLKLTPVHVMQLYETALTKQDVQRFIEEKVGAQWFWNNGESMLHTWILVMHGRGIHVQEMREKVLYGMAGVAVDAELNARIVD